VGGRFHEAAKAIDAFVINSLSQTYVPITRNIIWDDSQENLSRRLSVYSVISHTLMQIDIMLHPFCPFITDYLYLTCFKTEKDILLERWPIQDENLVNSAAESAFDMIKEIVSVANAARNVASIKRRWPVKEVIICAQNFNPLEMQGLSFVLENQLNAERYKLVEIGSGSQLQKVASMLDKKLPVSVTVSLIRKNIAPRVKADINKVSEAFEAVDKVALVQTLKSSDSFPLEYNGKTIKLSSSDIEISYKALEGYSSSERDGLVVFIATMRDKDLITKGLLRDIARQLQQLRKERQYNPTDILDAAYVVGLTEDEIRNLSMMKDDLSYLVRVKNVTLLKNEDTAENVRYKSIDIDERTFQISVE
jgi:isoleucyl-tRNA synthetase